MRSTISWIVLAVVGTVWFGGLSTAAAVAQEASSTKISAFAPANYVEQQIEAYIKELEEAVEDQDEYADSKEGLVKDASTLILLAVAAGLHDQDNKYKAAAPALVAATKQVLSSSDYASAKKAVDAAKAAVTTQGDPGSLKWEKLASLEALMEQVPLVNSRLKRYMRRFSRSPETVAANAATLAVIAHGSMANADETEKPSEVAKWHQFCVHMRDAAAQLVAAAGAEDEAAAKAAMEKLQQSCEDCHAVFHQEEQ